MTTRPAPPPALDAQANALHACLDTWLAASAESVERWRERGDDDDAILLHLATGRVDRIIERRRDMHRHVLVSSFPKSASTFTRKLLCGVTGFQPCLLSVVGNDSSRDLRPESIPFLLGRDTISVEHMRATSHTIDLLARMRIRPVVLVRDLFDTLISSRDHQLRAPGGRRAVAHSPDGWHSGEPAAQQEFLVHMIAPWYLTFFASWQDAARELPVLWITYDQITTDTEATVGRILEHCGVDVSPSRIDACSRRLDLEGVRFNRGVSGRGRRELTKSQCRVVSDLAATFRDGFDFSLIGL